MEKDKDALVRQLLALQQDIASQNNDGDLRDIYQQYARYIAQETNPYRKTAMKKEAQKYFYGTKLIESAKAMLSRKSPLSSSASTLKDEIEAIRRRAGSKLTKTPNLEEENAISSFYKPRRK
jgi:hypothetical protein